LSEVIRAAGGIVVRAGKAMPELLLVHRPKYDDWSFPKGKANRGETDAECALREVEEETGLRCRLQAELPGTAYMVGSRRKEVRYWLMEVLSGEPVQTNEVDRSEWFRVDEARARLTYAHDRDMLEAVPAWER
jgi:8-oxo-dGTP pyrophosphatase MutT (NUDIX family)